MRFFGMLALLAASTTLGGCPSGDGSALTLASSGPVCGVNAGQCGTPATTGTGTGGTGTGGTGTGGTTTTPAVNVGNTVVIPVKPVASAPIGDVTIAIENGKYTVPSSGTALSILTPKGPSVTDPALSNAKFQIDTKTTTNGNWPIAKTMKEYKYGTCFGYGVAPDHINCLSVDGKGTGLGGHYKEYRHKEDGTTIDEILQVWTWKNSYATQYRDETGGGPIARNQAWSFGGTKTPGTSMPVSGSAHYAGEYGGTAESWNWIDIDGSAAPGTPSTDPYYHFIQTTSNNRVWRVVGTSSLDADFLTGKFSGILTPKIWYADQNMHNFKGERAIIANDLADLSHATFMDDNIILNGTIKSVATSKVGDNSATAQNTITGTAELDPFGKGWFNTDSKMYAAFFGDTADSVTGIYNFTADGPQPVGGIPIANSKHGYIHQSGVFNGCLVAPCY
jgi:hypothetical protein